MVTAVVLVKVAAEVRKVAHVKLAAMLAPKKTARNKLIRLVIFIRKKSCLDTNDPHYFDGAIRI